MIKKSLIKIKKLKINTTKIKKKRLKWAYGRKNPTRRICNPLKAKRDRFK